MKKENKMKLIIKGSGYYLYQVENRYFRISNLYSSDWDITEMKRIVAFDGVIDWDVLGSVCSCNTLKYAKEIIKSETK